MKHMVIFFTGEVIALQSAARIPAHFSFQASSSSFLVASCSVLWVADKSFSSSEDNGASQRHTRNGLVSVSGRVPAGSKGAEARVGMIVSAWGIAVPTVCDSSQACT